MMIWYGCQPLRIHARAGVPKGFTGFQRLDLLWGTWNRFNVNPMMAGNMSVSYTHLDVYKRQLVIL